VNSTFQSLCSSLGCIVFERGWLSSNNIVFTRGEHTAIVDTGYCTHAEQTVNLVRSALQGRALDAIFNTHLHSDHCGGNAALLAEYPAALLSIPPGHAKEVLLWDTEALSYAPTGQSCPPFAHHHVLFPGTTLQLGQRFWEVHAAPGHDPHSVIFFEPESRTLISADALWENGFGVIFQELEGMRAFDTVADTLDLIERLDPLTIIPGHGGMFVEVAEALSRARSRLAKFVSDPIRHARYGAKVLLKYKLLELQRCSKQDLFFWTQQTSYFHTLHQRFFHDQTRESWLQSLLIDLERTQTLQQIGDIIINCD
jgi:glyoxylase-like metal-dependent hydrolase (beta-lactamase superfamily II)